jgi:hypothetical protein
MPRGSLRAKATRGKLRGWLLAVLASKSLLAPSDSSHWNHRTLRVAVTFSQFFNLAFAKIGRSFTPQPS